MAKSHFHRKKHTFDDERRELIAHILECDVCLAVVANCRGPTTECASRCRTFHELLAFFEENPAFRSAGSHWWL